MQKTSAYCLIIVATFTLFIGFRARAQANLSRIGVNVSEGIRFYAVDATGRTSLLFDLSDDFAFYTQGEADWIILAPEAIRVSAQGDRGAFVVFRSIPGRAFEEAALFWFDIAQPTLHQVALLGAFGLEWSPDGDQILLRNIGLGVNIAAISQQLYRNQYYLLTLATENLLQLPRLRMSDAVITNGWMNTG